MNMISGWIRKDQGAVYFFGFWASRCFCSLRKKGQIHHSQNMSGRFGGQHIPGKPACWSRSRSTAVYRQEKRIARWGDGQVADAVFVQVGNGIGDLGCAGAIHRTPVSLEFQSVQPQFERSDQ